MTGFILKGFNCYKKSSHAQIMQFLNWYKYAFKNFYFDHLFQVSTCGSWNLALNYKADKENQKAKN